MKSESRRNIEKLQQLAELMPSDELGLWAFPHESLEDAYAGSLTEQQKQSVIDKEIVTDRGWTKEAFDHLEPGQGNPSDWRH